jgi:hypothetical protein
MIDGIGPRTPLDLSSGGLKTHPRSTGAGRGLVAVVLAGLAACSSGGSSGNGDSGDHAGAPAMAGSNASGGAAIAGAPGSQGGLGGGGAAGASPAGAGAAAAGGANPIGGAAGSAAGTPGEAGGGSSGAGGGSGSGGSVGALEAVSVPAGGAAVMSKMNLDSGALFLLKAVGALKAGTGADAQYGDLDAEYGGITAGGTGEDTVAGVDVGIDVGFKVERGTPGRKKWFGPYRSDHTYYVIVTGAGAPLSLKTIQPASSTATGVITVSIFRLSPTPTPMPVVLDSFNATLTNQIVHSNMTTTTSTVYLLKVSGEGKVGGNNLALGDADYMDYAPNGDGKVDIGDGNVDYGLGVDEFSTKVSPRLRWWGPWRQDHTYYMLFAGTGSPIGFMYYDIGYGDNSATDLLPVQILELP